MKSIVSYLKNKNYKKTKSLVLIRTKKQNKKSMGPHLAVVHIEYTSSCLKHAVRLFLDDDVIRFDHRSNVVCMYARVHFLHGVARACMNFALCPAGSLNLISLFILKFAQTCSKIGNVNGCNGEDDITSFGSIDALFEAEATTTTRYMLMGRRWG